MSPSIPPQVCSEAQLAWLPAQEVGEPSLYVAQKALQDLTLCKGMVLRWPTVLLNG